MASSGGQGEPPRPLSGGGSSSPARRAHVLVLREALFPAGARVLTMVSGGQDSLALLDILSGLAGTANGPSALYALHINHHLRGAESDADQILVERACARLGVPLTVAHHPVEKTGGNVQERARESRREAALATAADLGCDRVALGHTADDQAETMLYRLGRYGGLAAFRAMLPCDPPWVRPLLECRRAETAEYCRQRGLEYAEDRGNAYPGYARTALREQVLPAWEAALPGAVEAAARAAAVAAEMEALTEGLLADVEHQVVLRRGQAAQAPAPAEVLTSGADPTPAEAAGDHRAPAFADADALSAAALLGLEPALRRLVLHRWLEGRARPAATRASVLALESLLGVPGSASRDLGGGLHGVKEYDVVTLAGRRPAQAAPAAVRLAVPGRAEWGAVWVDAEAAERFSAPDITREAFVDACCLAGQVEVRGPLPGDRMRPLGSPGTRKVQDILVDLKIPAAQRPSQPLVVCDGRVIWLCGWVVAEEGRIARQTTGIVRLSMSPKRGT